MSLFIRAHIYVFFWGFKRPTCSYGWQIICRFRCAWSLPPAVLCCWNSCRLPICFVFSGSRALPAIVSTLFLSQCSPCLLSARLLSLGSAATFNGASVIPNSLRIVPVAFATAAIWAAMWVPSAGWIIWELLSGFTKFAMCSVSRGQCRLGPAELSLCFGLFDVCGYLPLPQTASDLHRVCGLKNPVPSLLKLFHCKAPLSATHLLTSVCAVLLPPPLFFHRAEDYWIGYKLFCFAYYSNSRQHEVEFEHSKLGGFIGSSARHFASSFSSSFSSKFSSCVFLGWALEVGEFILYLQGTLCGGVTGVFHDLPIGCFAPRACICFLLWRCFVNGSCRMIVAIFNHSCTGLTPNRNWSRMNWDDLSFS